MSKTIMRVDDVHKSYALGRTQVRVLRGANLEVKRGEFLVVRGASGSGKSTLLHIMGALDLPDRGLVEFNGVSLFGQSRRFRDEYRNRQVGFVFQFYHLLPELTVLENVLAPRLVTHGMGSWLRSRSKIRREADEMLGRVGLCERATHRPQELSGGERQRVAIARALMNRPELLLADEPTGNLDEVIGSDILALLNELNRSGQTIVMVTHDAKVAAHAHRQVRLTEGVVRTVDQTEVVIREPIKPARKVTP